jgi:hypothetical protein
VNGCANARGGRLGSILSRKNIDLIKCQIETGVNGLFS